MMCFSRFFRVRTTFEQKQKKIYMYMCIERFCDGASNCMYRPRERERETESWRKNDTC